jgi:hypothetical protein
MSNQVNLFLANKKKCLQYQREKKLHFVRQGNPKETIRAYVIWAT